MNAGRPGTARPEVGIPDGLREVWALLCGTGSALGGIGLVAFGVALAGLGTESVFGVLLFLGAVLQLTNTFWAYRWKGFGLHLVVGVLYLVVGVYLIERPGAARDGLNVLVASCFLVSGVLRMALSVVERFESWAWTFEAGIASLVMGLVLLCQWPIGGLWAVGLFVGVELISSGVAWVLLGATVRPTGPPEP